jgi:alginate O-acetyltransferase complex protein AlgJ
MKTTSVSSTSTRWRNVCLITLFLVMLWLPALDTFFQIDRATLPRENRELARPPELKPGLGGLKEFIGGAEAYFNDHFGWRNQLIHLHRRLETGLFPKKSEPSLSVIVGRNGWLFLKADKMIEYYQGTRRFSPQDLLDWQALLEHRRDWLAQLGIKYVFTVAPNKESIYSEQVPDWMKKVQPDTKLDQFLAHMHAHSTVEVLDLRPALRTARQIAPTYYQTDIHWNYFGSFVAYQEIVKNLSKQLPGLEPLPLAVFKLENRPIPSGDLADWADVDVNENCAVFLTPNPDLPRLEMSSKPREYAVTFVGFTENPKAQGSAVIFGDSFGNGWAPFLGYHFGKVTYYHHYELSEKWIKQEKPDIVISEMLEQAFNDVNPKGFDDLGDYLMRRVLHLPGQNSSSASGNQAIRPASAEPR